MAASTVTVYPGPKPHRVITMDIAFIFSTVKCKWMFVTITTTEELGAAVRHQRRQQLQPYIFCLGDGDQDNGNPSLRDRDMVLIYTGFLPHTVFLG
jgi:hypothetical protein